MQRMSGVASFQKCRLVGRIGSGVRVGASFPKTARFVGQLGSGPRLVSRIGSGPCLVGRVGSEVRVSDSFHILSCAVIHTVARSGFRDTRPRCMFSIDPSAGTFGVLVSFFGRFSIILCQTCADL